MTLAGETLPPPPKAPAGMAPPRLPGSVRRTSSIDVDWPDGLNGPMRLAGRARDIFTRAGSRAPAVFGKGEFTATINAERRILALSASPDPDGLQALVGERAGGHLRGAIAASLPGEKHGGTPLHLVLDDIAGTSLISPWAWSLWDPQFQAMMRARKADPKFGAASRENICSGLRAGSSGLATLAEGTDAGMLRDPADPEGWHEFPAAPGPGMRRARRIDISRDTLIRIDAHFQDSATTPVGPRMALHEYRIRATADPVSLKLLTLEAEPRVLPFPECPAAAPNARRLEGKTLAELRETVLDELRGTLGCTHLNDALRALADVPLLLRHLEPMAPAA